ncbi:MAG TPA: hypothetical protein VEB43_12285 [Anaeromyxobacter sp.]|nr:hypothetical protein [Anaeromyxobacter sp.]
MIRRVAPSIAAAALLAAGCASTPSAGGYQAPIRLNAPELVAWEPEGPFDLKLVVFNGTAMQIQLVGPKPEAAQVTLFRADGSVACKTPNPAKKTYDIWWIRKLNAASGMEVRLDVRSFCRDLPPGAYRYEAIYVANTAHGGAASLYQGTFGPEKGHVLVREGATKMKYEDLRAALEAKPDAASVTAGTTPDASAPPAGGATPANAGEPASATEPTPAAAQEPAVSPADIRACVDRELAARSLNAYGDPKGTVYDSGAPVDEYGRILYVASRNPAIRQVCGIPKF